MKTATTKFSKLRRLLGQHTTAVADLAFWQRAETAPTEQWRGQDTIQRKLAEARSQIASIEHEIASEMLARLGVPKGAA
jgi:sucrose-6-phosphate hydrolase SacC (GH32 family)